MGAAGEQGRCLLITSAHSGEGKTTLSARLAACCAKAGASTLVIDGDLRQASLSRSLGHDQDRGLCDVLEGALDAEDAPILIPGGGFHLLPAGTRGTEPGRLLTGRRLGRMLSAYRKTFQIILVDSPPVLPVPDPLTIGRWSDGAVMVVRYDVSRFPLVDQARRRIVSAGVPILKTVFNDVPPGNSRYGYGYRKYAYNTCVSRPPEWPTVSVE